MDVDSREPYVIDATVATPDGTFCFCPVEFDEHGEVLCVIAGLSFLSSKPPDQGKFVGVFHEDSDEKLTEFCEQNHEIIEKLYEEADARSESVEKEEGTR